MFRDIIRNFMQSPVKYPVLVFKKVFVYPFKYRTKKGYDARRYWDERLKKYGKGLKGVGEEGRSESDNEVRYRRVCEIFRQVCLTATKEFATLKVLEIGVGTGQMTRVLFDLGVEDYCGVDITDAMFPGLISRFGGRKFSFFAADVTAEPLPGKFDLIVIIDVIEHIVEPERFIFAMSHLKEALAEGGKIIIAPLVARNMKVRFYERHWSNEDLRETWHELKLLDSREWEPGFSQIAVFEK